MKHLLIQRCSHECVLPCWMTVVWGCAVVRYKGQVTHLLSFLCSYRKRLLHPGASTADILSQYISTMKSLHVVDPSGAAAERVCQPVQAYLRCVCPTPSQPCLQHSRGSTCLVHLSYACSTAAVSFPSLSLPPPPLCCTEPEKTLCDALWPASLTTREVTWLM